MLQFLYFGRLDQEKWRDAIIAMIEHFADVTTKEMGDNDVIPTSEPGSIDSGSSPEWQMNYSFVSNKQLPFVLHIFGKGSYEKKVRQLAEQFPQHIIYYGFQLLEKIKETAKQCDYCLMPSLFLETFGLSAVNALARWLPVIWYQQWGMAPFVIDEYNIASKPGTPDVQLIAMMDNLLAKWRHDESKKCHAIAKKYSKKQWIDNFNKICHAELDSASIDSGSSPEWQNNKNKKILLVTDFLNKLGGIETYVHDIAALLEEQWYTVVIIGSRWGKTRIGRFLSMFVSFCNVFFAWKLRKKINDFDPDIIWCHSVLRYIGWLGLHTVNRSSAQKRITYHDLGYFHPFPHTVTDTTQIPASLDWKDFSASIKNPLMKFFVWGKWIMIRTIHRELSQFDRHLVPSDFMQTFVKSSKNNVAVLPHFTQE